MRLIAKRHLDAFAARHPASAVALTYWRKRVETETFGTMAEVQAAFPKAKALNGERARFEIGGGDFRLVAAFDFRRSIVFVKFIGTHADYDRVDALAVSRF